MTIADNATHSGFIKKERTSNLPTMTGQNPHTVLLKATAQGDANAFKQLYELSSSKLYGVSYAILKSSEQAEEVLQDGFVKIWNNAAKFDSTKASAMTWMTTIVRNRALDVLRSRKSRPVEVDYEYEGLEFTASDISPEDQSSIELDAGRIGHCLKELKEDQRKSILMAYYYGYTHDEIAEQIGAPLGTVKAWVRRGVERLRTCL